MIFVFVDLHDGLEAIKSKIDGSYDLVCFLGDLSNKQNKELAEQVYDLIDFYIPGNIDSHSIIKTMEPKNFHYRLLKTKKFDIFGFGYSNPTPFNTPGELSEENISSMLSKITLKRPTILLTHTPPYGKLDLVGTKNVGSKALAEFIKRNSSNIIAHLYGHIHENIGNDGVHYNLKPAFLGGYAIIDEELNVRMY